MRRLLLPATILLILPVLVHVSSAQPTYAQGLTLEQIRTTLLDNPPNTGDQALREEAILALDEILSDDSSRTSQYVLDFYNSMMQKVNTELQETVSVEPVVWMMYNHGFVVKAPDIVFAFDLVDGYTGWLTSLPPDLIEEVKLLFISHRHLDHYDSSVADAVMRNDGYVVVPSEHSYMGNIPMSAGDSLSFVGLKIKAHEGVHGSTPSRIYEVTTFQGIRFMHTGDNQSSTTLPDVQGIDVLLLNAWLGVYGMRNSLDLLNPSVMIPGHIQELYHDLGARATYAEALEVDDVPLTSKVQVMAWGERYCLLDEELNGNGPQGSPWPENRYALHQNYPNPFNAATAIRFTLSRGGRVALRIINVRGEEVEVLLSGQELAGEHEVRWNPRNLPGGVYFYTLCVGEFKETKRLAFLR